MPLSKTNALLSSIESVGGLLIKFVKSILSFTLFVIKSLVFGVRRFSFKNFGMQFLDMGFFSISLVSLTGFFTGAVFALQSNNGLERFGAQESVPVIVILALTRELSPVLTGLIFISRVGSRISAETGSMVVSKQISAMKFLGVSPYSFVILPRIISSLVSLPLLCIVFTCVGSLGAFLVCKLIAFLPDAEIVISAIDILTWQDFNGGIIKSAFFGFFIGSISSYCGSQTKGGSYSVGEWTTKSVVYSSIFVLFLNYILTSILL